MILSVTILLITIFLSMVGLSNSWFKMGLNSSKTSGIRVELNISSQLAWNVYQRTGTNTDRKLGEDSYISIYDSENAEVGEIMLDTDYTVKLVLKEEETTNQTAYLRYKIEFKTQSGADITPVTITGNSASLVKKDDGYYYYQNNGANATLDNNAELTLMTTFNIPFDTFESLKNSESIKIILTVEASDSSTFSTTT